METPAITLVTMGQGNAIALGRTLESFAPYVKEVIFGDLCVFVEDSLMISTYQQKYNMRMIKLPFNFIFKKGFSAVLNELASHASNPYVLYMNVSEVIDKTVTPNFHVGELFNRYYFTHAVEKHHWFRMYNRNEVEWRGFIHEETRALEGVGNRDCPIASFQMADTEKDMENPFKAKVYNDVKELCYFQQYIHLVEDPSSIGVTHQGWVDFAKDGYESMTGRMKKKGKRYEAFLKGDLSMYLEDVYINPEFAQELHVSNDLINYQGDRKLL